MIGVIDVGIGNLSSLGSALTKLNIKFKFCKNKDELKSCKKFFTRCWCFWKFYGKIKS